MIIRKQKKKLIAGNSARALLIRRGEILAHNGTKFFFKYSHLSNNRGGGNKCGGSAKVAKSINVEVGINVEGGIFWKKLVHKCNKRGVEGGKNLRNQ